MYYLTPPIAFEYKSCCGNDNNIYHLYSQGIDMRKGVEGLCGIIRTYQYSSTNQALRTIV